MTRTLRNLWPGPVRRPWLRLALALLGAPLLLAAVLSAGAFVLAGASMPDRAGTLAATAAAAAAFFTALPAFALSFGLAGVAALWALGLRGWPAWAAAGAAAGAAAALLRGVLAGEAMAAGVVGLAAGLGMALFLLIRRMAGVRPG